MQVESATEPSPRHGLTFIDNPVVSITLSLLITIALKLLIETTWTNLIGLWNVWWRRTVGTLFIALAGWVLFRVRRHHQRSYGRLEIAFALVVCWTYIGKAQIEQDAASYIAVAAAAYLIVRGLTNCEEGKKKGLA